MLLIGFFVKDDVEDSFRKLACFGNRGGKKQLLDILEIPAMEDFANSKHAV